MHCLPVQGYCSWVFGDLSYLYYETRTRRPLFITIIVMASIALIAQTVLAVLLLDIPRDLYDSLWGKGQVTYTLILLFPCPYYLNILFIWINDRTYSCKNCNLTGVGKQETIQNNTKAERHTYTDNGSIYTEDFKVNGTNVTVEYHTAPKTYVEYETIHSGVDIYSCKI